MSSQKSNIHDGHQIPFAAENAYSFRRMETNLSLNQKAKTLGSKSGKNKPLSLFKVIKNTDLAFLGPYDFPPLAFNSQEFFPSYIEEDILATVGLIRTDFLGSSKQFLQGIPMIRKEEYLVCLKRVQEQKNKQWKTIGIYDLICLI